MSGQKQKREKTRIVPWVARTGLKTLAGLILLSVLQVAILKYATPPFTLDGAWQWFACRTQSGTYRAPSYRWVPLEAISPHLQQAVMAAEDQRFLHHHGFDFIEMRAALEDILSAGRVRGASTISMQAARTVFLLRSRNLCRKFGEAYYTVLIEMFWGKRRILEMYLNTVDWGTGIMGAEAAARAYYHRGSGALSRKQAARLAAVLPNPHRLSPVRPTRYVRARARRILADMPRMPRL